MSPARIRMSLAEVRRRLDETDSDGGCQFGARRSLHRFGGPRAKPYSLTIRASRNATLFGNACGTDVAPSRAIMLMLRVALILLSLCVCAARVHSHPGDVSGVLRELNSCLRVVRHALRRSAHLTNSVFSTSALSTSLYVPRALTSGRRLRPQVGGRENAPTQWPMRVSMGGTT
jgi:hypothetical protein